jgi:hypothetical protein
VIVLYWWGVLDAPVQVAVVVEMVQVAVASWVAKADAVRPPPREQPESLVPKSPVTAMSKSQAVLSLRRVRLTAFAVPEH